MHKELNYQNGVTDGFAEKFKSERLEVGSDNYRAVREALEIGRLYYLNYQSSSGLVSGLDEKKMDRHKERVVKLNDNNPVFTDKFMDICDWMTADLGTLPAIRIFRKLRILVDKISEVDGGTDLV